MSHHVTFVHLPERPGRGRLGRHVEHDERSRSFGVVRAASAQPVTKAWERHCAPFDQGDLGSCTGNAMAGALMTGPLFRSDRVLTEEDAVHLYKGATHLDHVPGVYPPDDTGSSGVAVARAAKAAGYLESYRHAFGLADVLHALSFIGPGIAGIGWYEGFDAPRGTAAELVIGGEVRGGHEVELLAIDVERRLVRGVNSWGSDWGDHGYFTISFDTFSRLLAERGDFVVPLS